MKARCACGALTVEILADPLFAIACHCIECQRRTGAPFGAGVYYPRGEVEASGAATDYSRPTETGDVMRNRFCPTCGTSLFWTLDGHPDLIGVALGAIDDPKPEIAIHSLWERSKQDWISLDAASAHYPQNYPMAG